MVVVGQGDHKSPVEQWTTAVERHQSRSHPMTHGPTGNDRKLDGERTVLKMGQKKKPLEAVIFAQGKVPKKNMVT